MEATKLLTCPYLILLFSKLIFEARQKTVNSLIYSPKTENEVGNPMTFVYFRLPNLTRPMFEFAQRLRYSQFRLDSYKCYLILGSVPHPLTCCIIPRRPTTPKTKYDSASARPDTPSGTLSSAYSPLKASPKRSNNPSK